MSHLEKLWQIAPPPKKPKGVGSLAGWLHLEAQLGFELPAHYKEFIASYGNGRFAEYFGVVNPFHTAANDINFSTFVQRRTNGVRLAQSSYPDYAVALPVYPNKGGLFPWGYTDNGDTMFWLTEGDNSAWPIICVEIGYTNNLDRFELTIPDFIEQWLTQQISVPTLTPSDFFPLRKPGFVSSH